MKHICKEIIPFLNLAVVGIYFFFFIFYLFLFAAVLRREYNFMRRKVKLKLVKWLAYFSQVNQEGNTLTRTSFGLLGIFLEYGHGWMNSMLFPFPWFFPLINRMLRPWKLKRYHWKLRSVILEKNYGCSRVYMSHSAQVPRPYGRKLCISWEHDSKFSLLLPKSCSKPNKVGMIKTLKIRHRNLVNLIRPLTDTSPANIT